MTPSWLGMSGSIARAQTPEENLAVLDGWMGHVDAPNSLYRTLYREARTPGSNKGAKKPSPWMWSMFRKPHRMNSPSTKL